MSIIEFLNFVWWYVSHMITVWNSGVVWSMTEILLPLVQLTHGSFSPGLPYNQIWCKCWNFITLFHIAVLPTHINVSQCGRTHPELSSCITTLIVGNTPWDQLSIKVWHSPQKCFQPITAPWQTIDLSTPDLTKLSLDCISQSFTLCLACL